jgi:hypothetical protein
MISEFLSSLRNVFKTDVNDVNDAEFRPKEKDLSKWDFMQVDNIKYPQNYIEGNDNLIILDDDDGLIDLTLSDIDFLHHNTYVKDFCDQENTMLRRFDKNKFNIFIANGVDAVFKLKKHQIETPGFKFDFAIQDIFLGGRRMIDNKMELLDGVDSYQILKESNKDCKVNFFTSFTMQDNLQTSEKYKEKFKKMTGHKMDRYITYKTPNFIDRRRVLLRFLSSKK